MALITLDHVTRQYGSGDVAVLANDQVSFDIEAGEFVVILGPSGAGKSTVLNILGGMDTPTSGAVWVDGKDIAQMTDRQRTTYRRNAVGFVFQFYNLIPNLTALENVEMSEQIANQSFNAEEVLEAVGLAHVSERFPAELSGGEQQRIAIARAIAKNPKLLLCDEPTGALDQETGDAIMALLLEQSRQYQRTVIVITHNQAFTALADRVIEIHDGRVSRIYHSQRTDSFEAVNES
ncbi:MAG: ABC transporter ATP-binding protein [Aerococcus sp.]|nr:ABC transporter ATP-binding protein [Aerococcus sp.]